MTTPQAIFHLPVVIWITGLPAAGKTTLAMQLQTLLRARVARGAAGWR